MIKSLFFISLLAISSIAFVSCSDDETTPTPVVATTFTNLPADPGTGFNPDTGQPIGTTGKFALFSFETGEIVPIQTVPLRSGTLDFVLLLLL
jgi:hypothetical protein